MEVTAVDESERLRRLALNQLLTEVRATDGSQSWLEPSLDAKAVALIQVGALVAMGDASVPSYGAVTDRALSAGATVEEVVAVLLAILPVIGSVRVATAAPKVALALGDDVDDLPDGPSSSW